MDLYVCGKELASSSNGCAAWFYRSIYQKRHKGASVGGIMTFLRDTWRIMIEEGQGTFIELAKEEAV